MAYFVIREAKNLQYYFVLKANNHEPIGVSETYTTKQSARVGTDSVKRHAQDLANFRLFEGKDRKWYFHLKAINGEIILQSEGYNRRESANGGALVVHREAPTAPVYDYSNQAA